MKSLPYLRRLFFIQFLRAGNPAVQGREEARPLYCQLIKVRVSLRLSRDPELVLTSHHGFRKQRTKDLGGILSLLSALPRAIRLAAFKRPVART
jgi:hypothetical protein